MRATTYSTASVQRVLSPGQLLRPGAARLPLLRLPPDAGPCDEGRTLTMTAQIPEGPTKFDAYADDYQSLVEASITTSGESPEYFADYKLRCLLRLGAPTGEPIIDFGAGTGSLTAKLVRQFRSVTAYEPSERSLRVIQEQVPGATCVASEAELPEHGFSTAVVAGVLHHVPPGDRTSLLARLRNKLRPGGRLVIFEHNPWNPLTRHAVATCPFDDDAQLLWPSELRALVRGAGYSLERLDYIVFFPRILARLRPLEPSLRRFGLGAQTMTVASNSDAR